jgi:hypothetical protein
MMQPGDGQQVSPPQKRRASPPLHHSATKMADKKDGGQALDLLTTALKIDCNKPMHVGILEKPKCS